MFIILSAFVQGTHMNAVLRLTTAFVSFYKSPISVQALSPLPGNLLVKHSIFEAKLHRSS